MSRRLLSRPDRSPHALVGRRVTAVTLLLFLGGASACGGESDAKTPGGAGGGPRGGGQPPVVLAATDVGTIRRGAIESGTPVTGDLRPIESVSVRARLEGDLVGVFAREGDRVREGQLLARFDALEQTSDRTSAQADEASARGELQTAQWNAEQSAELLTAGAIPERDNRAAQQAVVAARARVAAATARVRATGSIENDTRVLAPLSGIVAARMVEDGERVTRGAEMFTVVRNDVLELTAAVPARLADGLRTGQAVRFVASGRDFTGTVARVSPTVDPVTRAINVYVRVPNADGALKGNSFAAGRIVGRTLPSALLVPTAAIRTGTVADSSRPYVYRVANGTLARVPLTVGVVDDAAAMAEVLAGLQEGDQVIVGNVGALGDGIKVQIVGGGSDRPGQQAARPAPAVGGAAAAATVAPLPRRQ